MDIWVPNPQNKRKYRLILLYDSDARNQEILNLHPTDIVVESILDNLE
mgnify:FL=1